MGYFTDEEINEEFDSTIYDHYKDALADAEVAIEEYIKAKRALIWIVEHLSSQFDDQAPLPAECSKERKSERDFLRNELQTLECYIEDGVKDGDDFHDALEFLEKENKLQENFQRYEAQPNEK